MAIKVFIGQFFVEKFVGKGSFILWQRRMKDLLVQQGLNKVLQDKKGKSMEMEDDEWQDIEMRTINTIHLSLAENVDFNVMDCTSLMGEVREVLHGKKSHQQVIFLAAIVHAKYGR